MDAGLQRPKKVAIISENEGVVVRGILKKLTDSRISAVYVGIDSGRISLGAKDSDYFVAILDENVQNYVDVLKFVMGIIVESDSADLIMVGEKREFELIHEKMPGLNVTKYMDRPVDLEAFVEYIQNHEHVARERLVGLEAKTKLSFVTPPEGVEFEDVKHILIVDDDPTYAKMVREWIKDVYKTAVVTSGMQAITYLLKNKVDLVMLDYEMPVVDGPQVLQMLRDEETTKDIPVVFLTGVNSIDRIKKVMSLKPSGYLLKSSPSETILDWLLNFFKQ